MPESDAGAGGHGDVLVGRLAAALVNHEPGWRLPRPSEIARRHNASLDAVRAAIDDLAARRLIRKAPDGYLYLAGPAEYLVSLEGMAGLCARADPMSGELTCLSYGVSRQAASADMACALRIPSGEPVGVLRLAWALNGAPAAVSTTHLAGNLAEPDALAMWLAERAERGELPLLSPAGHCLDRGRNPQPDAVAVQMRMPSASAACKLRMRPGQLALIVSILLSDGHRHEPAALTVTVMRPDMFQITLQTRAG
jgi:DNA-binding GntR family transcriptional regulator